MTAQGRAAPRAGPATRPSARLPARLATRLTAGLAAAALLAALVACDGGHGSDRGAASAGPVSPGGRASSTPSPPVRAPAAPPRLVPVPVSLRSVPTSFTLGRGARVSVSPGVSPQVPPDALAVGRYLAEILRPSTAYPLPVVAAPPVAGDLSLALVSDAGLGREGYRLDVAADGVHLAAHTAEGLFRGVQTLRQLFPAAVESRTARPGPWVAPGVQVLDRPRFSWRGTMLDVSRHFFTVAQVKRYVDLAALYKINVLHLHLSDDQGWRIAIRRWPRLTARGGSTAVGGGRGGYYTQRDYAEIVRYAASRYVTLVPEIDMPGHTTAALASYAELNCGGRARGLETRVSPSFSTLCVRKELTYRFLDDVIGDLAALTPGPYLDIGGDEAGATGAADYVTFVERVSQIVRRHGKRMVGWHQIARARLPRGTVAQYWDPASGSGAATALARAAAAQHVPLVMSPADRVYLDMKYTASTRLGLNWAGPTEVREAYEWDPASLVGGVPERDVLGVEAPLWTETLDSAADVEFMAFPRLAGAAEIGWSPRRGRSWSEYRPRLAAQGVRWTVLGVNFYRSPQVPWFPGSA